MSTFEELDFALVLHRRLARGKSSQIAPFAGLWVLLSRIKSIFSARQFSNHIAFNTLLSDNIIMSFSNLGIQEEILRAIKEQGYETPTPIQAQAIPLILAKSDVMAGAQTGTGKTAGFTLPLLHLLASKKSKKPRALILTPTRELAAQVKDSVSTYGKFLHLRSTQIIGGVAMGPQIKALRAGVDIIIATPGRLLDHVSQKTVDLTGIEILVLDEADRMLDMGFIHDIKKILQITPKDRQTLLFSATFSREIKQLAAQFMKEPALIEIERNEKTYELISQMVYPVDTKRKRELLTTLIHSNQWKQVLVFTRTKHGANRLTDHLIEEGIPATAIHGNKSQGARMQALKQFKQGTVRVLVATDVAARGIDIDELPHVINFELPNSPEDYVHRIGRTGRAGNSGEAISLVSVDERKLLQNIERLLKQKITSVVIPGFEPNPSIRPEPIFKGRRKRRF